MRLLQFTISFLVYFQAVKAWQNEYDGVLTYTCPGTEIFYRVKSQHHNYYNDRLFEWSCKKIDASSDLTEWSAYNDYDATFTYECPENYGLASIDSHQNNWYEDRRFRFRCKKVNLKLSDCAWSNYANSMDGWLHYTVPEGTLMTGVYSYHENYYNDRRFMFQYCRYTDEEIIPARELQDEAPGLKQEMSSRSDVEGNLKRRLVDLMNQLEARSDGGAEIDHQVLE